MAYCTLTPEEAEEREQLLFGRHYSPLNYSAGGICRFGEVSAETARKLIERGFVDPDDTQNSSPTMKEMVDFCDDETDFWYLHGYAVSPNRFDCRVTFEGVGSHGVLGLDAAYEFLKHFRDADEITIGCDSPAWCWYD